MYRQAADLAETAWKGTDEDLESPSVLARYYGSLYAVADLHAESHEIGAAIDRGDFPTVARMYRIIKETGTPLVVPYGKGQELLNEAVVHGVGRSWFRRVQPYIVNVKGIRAVDPPAWLRELSVPSDTRRRYGMDGWYELVNPASYGVYGLDPVTEEYWIG
jgi:hypothetical protein